MKFRKRLAALAALPAAAALTVLGLTLSPAGAATVTPVTPGVNLAGYQVQNGLAGYNEVRGTVHLPAADPAPASDYGQVGVGILLQQYTSGGWTAGLAFVWTGADTWTLEASTTGTPSSPFGLYDAADGASVYINTSALKPVVVNGQQITLQDGASYYLEIHYSTKLREIAFVAGPGEFASPPDLGTPDFTVHVKNLVFEGPAIGATTTTGTVANALTTGTLVSFTRDGLTQLDNPHATAGGTNGRLNFASQPVIKVEATLDGGNPSNANPYTMSVSGFGSGGSFAVTAP